MKNNLRSKLIFALTSLIIVPTLVVIFVIILMRFNVVEVPVMQDLNISDIQITAPGKNPEDLKMVPFTLIGIFFIAMIGMVVVISKVLSDFVLLPLKELNYAAERIGAGELDFQIKYNKANEFGKLCSEFDTMKDKLQLSIKKQEIYEKSRKELIASITHDLKTPLTSIIGYVEGLQDGVVSNPDTIQNYLNVIHDKSIRLDHLIDDLFTFTQLELEQFTVNKSETAMEYMLGEYAHTKIREYQSNEAIDFIVLEPIHEGTLCIDEFRIGQVLENIISNAQKFTKTFIKLYTETDDLYYNIYIEDDGIGISKEDLPHIFDYFYQCDKARESKNIGTGLGLAICKQLIEAHGGKIYVTSKLNEGTIFKISLKKDMA
ncbi:MAG: HAMP domain-containing histidine kinase [Clostridia bacterium]|nr:HAMP domain-containing histidine kinase [Clostridia bacterium]